MYAFFNEIGSHFFCHPRPSLPIRAGAGSSWNMKKLRHVLVALLGLWVLPFSVHAASAAITEIMYDLPGTDSGREWVEVQNTGGEAVSFAQWKFFEGNTNHGLSFFRGEATTSPGGFAVIADDPAKFLLDWPSFSGTLFSSSFSLGNSGEVVALKLDGAVVDEVSYTSATGASGDGASLQKTTSGWRALSPTPGADASPAGVSSLSGSVAGQASSSGESGSAGTPTPAASAPGGSGGAPSPIEQKIFVGISAPGKTVVGADVLFEAIAFGLKKEPLQNARYLWSFGDGGSAEGKRVLHAYHYPATYVVLVEASSGEWSATERRDIAAAAPAISIPRIKEGPDGFIEVSNSGADDVDLSRWFLRSGSAFFTFPKGTILPARKTTPFAAAITKLAAEQNDTAVLYPNGTLSVRYVPPPPATPVASPTIVTPGVSGAGAARRVADVAAKQPGIAVVPQREAEEGEEGVPVSGSTGEFSASVVVSGEGSSSRAALWATAAAALVLVSLGGYVFANRTPRREPTDAEELSREAEEYDLIE